MIPPAFPDRPLRAPAVLAAITWRKANPSDAAAKIVDALLLVIAHCAALLEDAAVLADVAALTGAPMEAPVAAPLAAPTARKMRRRVVPLDVKATPEQIDAARKACRRRGILVR